MEVYLIVIIAISAIILLGILMKLYIKLTTGVDKSETSLVGKTAIITGANTGIGFQTALEFAKRGARVILACRNKTYADNAKNEITERTGNENIIIKLIDFASLESIRNFAQDINESEEKIHILVNNAGAGNLENKFTTDGFQILMQVNYFGSFLLTYLLLDKLKQSAPSRIINVASIAAKISFLNLEHLNTFPSGPFADTRLYSRSKLCNILFTVALAEKLKGTQVTTNCLHPGIVGSEFYRNFPAVIRVLTIFFIGSFFKSTKEGAQTSIYLALSPKVKNVTGKYFEDCKKKSLFWNANKRRAEALWQKTELLLFNR